MSFPLYVDPVSPISSNRVDTFYVAGVDATGVDPAVLRTINSTGDIGATEWTLPANSVSMSAMGISLDETTVYYGREIVGDGIHQCTIGAGGSVTPISDLVTFGASQRCGRDILILADHTLLATIKPFGSTAWEVWNIHPTTGATIRTFTFGASAGSAPRIATDIDDPNSFWVLSFPPVTIGSTAFSKLTHFRVSDGAILQGPHLIPQRQPDLFGDVEAFGPAQSCPLLVLVEPLDACETQPSTMTITLDCDTGIVTITLLSGASFESDATIELTGPGGDVPFTVIDILPTAIHLAITFLAAGEYCATVTNPSSGEGATDCETFSCGSGNGGSSDCAVPSFTVACPGETTGTVGTPYASSVVASDGVSPYTYALNAGVLPPGIALNPSTGAITGTPITAGRYPFTPEITDSDGTIVLTDCVITVSAAAVTPPSIGGLT